MFGLIFYAVLSVISSFAVIMMEIKRWLLHFNCLVIVSVL